MKTASQVIKHVYVFNRVLLQPDIKLGSNNFAWIFSLWSL